jgi:hypothetical protein
MGSDYPATGKQKRSAPRKGDAALIEKFRTRNLEWQTATFGEHIQEQKDDGEEEDEPSHKMI